MSNTAFAGAQKALEAAGLCTLPRSWQRLRGGRVNQVWRISTPDGALVLKRYGPLQGTGLFPNRPADEAAALAAMAPRGLAPTALGQSLDPARPWLIYRYEPQTGPLLPEDAGRVLAKLHRSPPWPGLPQDGSTRWRSDPRAVQKLTGFGLSRAALATLRAGLRMADASPRQLCPLHGDPVPGNLLATEKGALLIDWQCPLLGDPIWDLAIYLSPGMQLRYGQRPLSRSAQRQFLQAYNAPKIARRYQQQASPLHGRIALHLLGQGRPARAALRAEIALINRLAR
ncbi:MAG: phosphotransferase [Mangrovicoccus sp.]|nr:phosphotransferase [Mangrovicoccus sp.]